MRLFRFRTFAPAVAALTALTALAAPARPLPAQWGFWPADSLLAAGHLFAAESAYYAASRARPRDPVARAALGRYLAARGATRVAAVLLEEAQFFGGDSAALARVLAPLYARMGAYGALDSLRPSVLGVAERTRVKWLARHAPEVRLGDSIVVVTYHPIGDGRGIGTVLIRLGRTELPAVIDPRVSGLIVPSGQRKDVRPFGNEGRNGLAVAPVVRIGGAVFTNVPVVVGDGDEKVRIGFDVLAPYFPGFDPRSGLLTLRRVSRRSPPPAGARVPALFDSNGLRLLIGGRWQSSSAAMSSMLLATRRWMWDAKLGDVVLLSDGAATPP